MRAAGRKIFLTVSLFDPPTSYNLLMVRVGIIRWGGTRGAVPRTAAFCQNNTPPFRRSTGPQGAPRRTAAGFFGIAARPLRSGDGTRRSVPRGLAPAEKTKTVQGLPYTVQSTQTLSIPHNLLEIDGECGYNKAGRNILAVWEV